MEGQPRGISVEASMSFGFLPIVKVFTICFVGFLMAYLGKLPANGRKLLNGFYYHSPVYFKSVVRKKHCNLEGLLTTKWFIPINILLTTAVGSIIGYIVALIIQPPHAYFRFTIVHIGIGNIGNIPLVLIAALCNDPSNPLGDSKNAARMAIPSSHLIGALVLYTHVFWMLSPPPEGFDGSKESELPNTNMDSNEAPEQVPLLSKVTHKVVQLSNSWRNVHDILCVLLAKILQPPLVSSILAIAICIVPFLKNLILTDDAPLSFLTNSLVLLGQAMVPCILLALGGNLVDGPGVGRKKMGVRTISAIIFSRLVLIPISGLGIVNLADKLGFLPDGDKMFRFVLLLQHSMPTSVLSGAVANLQGCGEESASV